MRAVVWILMLITSAFGNLDLANAAPITFEADGVTWTVVEGGRNAPLSSIHMLPGFAKACPTHTVKLVPSDGEGSPMTAEQQSRRDKRWRIVCVRDEHDLAPITFEADGVTWTVVEGGRGVPLSTLHMPAGAARACPSHRVKLILTSPDEGPPMTAEQKFRGDARWRVVCVRD
jgi:hypothetical protein